MTRKAQADVDMVKQKLDGEREEKRLTEKKKQAEQYASIEDDHIIKIKQLEERLEQSKRDTAILVQRDEEESRQLEEEGELFSQHKRLASLEVEHMECAVGSTSGS